jgi:DNA topoisomerase IB
VTNRNKAKGSAWERAIVDHLKAAGWPYAERRLAGSTKDRGDIAGVVGVVIEAKNTATRKLAEWVDEADLERTNDGAWLGVVWHKRTGKTAAADGYVTMTGAQFTALLARALDIQTVIPVDDSEAVQAQ